MYCLSINISNTKLLVVGKLTYLWIHNLLLKGLIAVVLKWLLQILLLKMPGTNLFWIYWIWTCFSLNLPPQLADQNSHYLSPVSSYSTRFVFEAELLLQFTLRFLLLFKWCSCNQVWVVTSINFWSFSFYQLRSLVFVLNSFKYFQKSKEKLISVFVWF